MEKECAIAPKKEGVSRLKIVNLEEYPSNPGDLTILDKLQKIGEVVVYDRTPLADEATIIERIKDADIVLVNKVQLSRSVIEACPNLKMIAEQATGYNNIDLKAASEYGIVVSNVPAYSTPSVAQGTFALLLEICNRVGHHSAEVYDGRWEKSGDWTFFDYPLVELSGKTIGIAGFGNIGREVGKIAKAFGMNVLAYNRSQTEEGRQIATYVTLDELYAQSDILSLHLPLSEETNELINKETLSKMKDGAILLNTARGQLINDQDVTDALNSGKLFGAGLDVTTTEPVKNENPLLTAKNCYITPHIVWAPIESRMRLLNQVLANIEAFVDGEPINVVNK